MRMRTDGRSAFDTRWAAWFAVVVLLWSGHVFSAETSAPLLIKISRLEKALDLIDSLGPSDGKTASTTNIRAMLQGVEWIDDHRAIVILVDPSGEEPLSAMLIPFRRANPNFRQAYNARVRDGYYVIALPPGVNAAVSETMEAAMASASQQADDATVFMTIPLRRILATNRERIDSMLRMLEQMPADRQNDVLSMRPDEVRRMAAAVLEAAQQIDSVSVGIDLNERQCRVIVETVPVSGSNLASFFSGVGMTTRLDGYRPDLDITFRSRSYRVDSLLDMLEEVMGPVYRELGIDFRELVSIGRNFSGETAGGMAYGEGAEVRFESIAVLRDEVDPEHFLEREYLPWTEAYGRNIGKMLEMNTGVKRGSVLTRTADSRVEGQRVVGMRIEIPLSPGPLGDGRPQPRDSFMAYDTRTAVKGNLLLVAPDDARMGAMIRMVDTLKKKTAHGPLMQFSVDMGRYLASLARLVPGYGLDPASIPDFGELTAGVSTGTGSVVTSAAMDTRDIRLMIAYLQGMKGGRGQRSPETSAP